VKRLETVVQIDAAPEEVWRVLVDFAAYPAWSPRLTVVGRPEPGQRLRVTAAAPGEKGMRFTPRVLTAEPGRALRWRGRVLLPGLCDGVHEFVLTPWAGGTQLVQAEDFSGLLVPFVGRALAQTEQGMREQNAALRQRVQSQVASA
jgi:hypothetical protein